MTRKPTVFPVYVWSVR